MRMPVILERIERWAAWVWYLLSARRVKRNAKRNDVIITRFGKLYFVDKVTLNGAVRIPGKHGKKHDYIMPKRYRVMEARRNVQSTELS